MAEAATTLLATKLFIPPQTPGLVLRPRLARRLDGVLRSRLTLISAPAGFGKSTLLGEWVHHNLTSVPTAWLSLEEGENDPLRFWDYFIAALRTIQPAVGEMSLTLLHSSQPVPIESTLTTLINDLAAFSGDFALVLDDYHFIQSPAVHQGLTFFVEHMAPGMHLIIATRVDPPLSLAHLRGKGTLLEIVADDLRFTLEETASLFAGLDAPRISADDVNALNTRAEGWVAGLKMAALSIRREKDIPAFIVGFTGTERYIMDYLIEEVLQRQSPEIRDFLLLTSVLERLSGNLCDAVTGRNNGRDTLPKVESENLFITPLDRSREWYRYHHLFVDLLRHQLEVKSGIEEVKALHQRASQWYEDNKFPDEAIHHALIAGDWKAAARIVSTQSEERIKRSEWSILLGWLRAIPEDVLRTDLFLYRQYCRTLIRLGQVKAADKAVGYLERMARDDANLQGETLVFRMDLARLSGDDPRAAEMAEKALSLLAPDNLAMRAWASFQLGLVHYLGGLLEEAQQPLRDAYELGSQAGYYGIGAAGAVYLGEILWQRGKLREAMEMVEQALDLAGQSPGAASARSTHAFLLYERNDLEGSARSAQMAVELGEITGTTNGVLLLGHYWLALIRLAQGDLAAAVAEMENVDRAVRLPGLVPAFRAYHTAFHVMFAVRRDELASAVDWGNRLQEYADILPFNVFQYPARLLIARGEKVTAAKQLQALYEKAAQAGAQGSMILTRIYQALAAATPAEALTFLTEALTLGQPERYIRSFVDEGRLLAPLLRQSLSQGIMPEYTSNLLNIIEAEDRRRKTRSELPSGSVANTDMLRARELEVLRLMSEGLSNPEIATKLMISLSTAKTHVHHILEKLYARDRAQAVKRAKELKLI